MKEILIATKNEGKLREIQKILRDVPIKILSMRDFPDLPEVVEDRDTFEGNAIKKARELAEWSKLPSLADDSGLMVDVLNGAPGVYSARFAGEERNFAKNNQKLLRLMEDVPDEERSASFVCVMCLATPKGDYQTVRGTCEGKITRELRGENGFGYDPLFYVDSYGKTFAELPPEVKNQISHRAMALKKMEKILKDF